MKFILDYSKWICGSPRGEEMGIGDTLLWNEQGYGCCLGHFGLCLGISKESMLGYGNPLTTNPQIESEFLKEIPYQSLSELIMKNDDFCITIDDVQVCDPSFSDRLRAIENILKRLGHSLEVINAPSEALSYQNELCN